jgi:hypothetical protein
MDQTEIRINGANGTTEKMWKYNCQLKIWVLVHRKITFGAAIGYSSGKNSSSLKTPPARQICRRHYIRTNMIRFYKINMATTSYLHPYLSTHNIFQLLYGIQKNGR